MQNNNNNNFSYGYYPCFMNCPFMQYGSGYYNQGYDNYFRGQEDEAEDIEETYEDFDERNYFVDEDEEMNSDDEEKELENLTRAPRDVDRVIKLINQKSSRDIEEIIRIGVDSRLVDYIIRVMVEFIDRNYNRYRGSRQQRIEEAKRDIRRNMPWIFDIMRIFSVSPATQQRLFDSIVSTSIDELRRQPKPPMPR